MTTGHDESGLVPSEDFDYSTVEKNLFGPDLVKELNQVTPAEMDGALKAFDILLRWIFQDGMKNPDGVKIRAIIVCWIFLKRLRPMTLTQVATGFGMDKQSLGRWVDQFKKDFPNIRTPHMRNL